MLNMKDDGIQITQYSLGGQMVKTISLHSLGEGES